MRVTRTASVRLDGGEPIDPASPSSESVTVRTRSRALSTSLIALLLVAFVLLNDDSATADGEPTRPGLPYMECKEPVDAWCFGDPTFANTQGWLGFLQRGATGSVKAKQWAQIPLSAMAANVQLSYPRDDQGRENYLYYTRAIFPSPKGAPKPYGYSPKITVRTVAFGSIPTEIDLQIAQRRDAQDLPIPFEVTAHDIDLYEDGRILFPTELDDHVNIDVIGLRVDGVDVGLTTSCRSARAHIKAASERVEFTQPSGGGGAFFDQNHGHYGFYGGTLRGTISIPRFAGCDTKTGDDVSAVLSSAVSGPGNPVTIQLGATNCTLKNDEGGYVPPPPYISDPYKEAGCISEYYVPYEHLRTNPNPRPFPNYAPGDGPPA